MDMYFYDFCTFHYFIFISLFSFWNNVVIVICEILEIIDIRYYSFIHSVYSVLFNSV